MTDINSTIHPLTPWSAEDYAPRIIASGANKLANSGVAPLVALARGYESLELAQVPDFARNNGVGAKNSKRYTQLLNIVRNTDALVLRWFAAERVASDRTQDVRPTESSMQLRPGSPRVNPATGKAIKYENMSGSASVIDSNPATPAAWFSKAPKILITEGVLKGDSALTAHLLANGVTLADMAIDGNMSPQDAMDKLHRLMQTVPERDRVLILSFIGVGNWKGNELWTSLNLRDRQLLLAFDGDIDSNWNVWSQANNLWAFAVGKLADVALVDLSVDTDGEFLEMQATNSAKPEKVGIDDYLVRHGDWISILSRLKDVLPDAPARTRDELEIGAWKVSEDGNSVQEFMAGPPVEGQPGPSFWKLQYNIGGRVVAVETHRAPTDLEVITAQFGQGLDDEDVPTRDTCRIDLKWIQADGTPGEATVTGPATILMYPPSEWDKRKAVIPNNLLMHDEWPPKKGSEWLSAIKGNNETPTEQRTSWTTMGWVPVENSSVCSFISGKTVISPNEIDRKKTVAGVTEVVLPGAAKFSLPVMDAEFYSAAWIKQVREDLDSLYLHYITNAPWTNINIAAVVIAAGLRAAVPLACRINLFVQGPPGQGKSWTVAQILAFHQARKTWTNQSLPGSMKDTGTSVEQAVAQANIWVMDDLAPSPDKRQNDAEQSKIGDLMRAVHNKAPKRRSGVDLQAREIFTPKALLITTAENEHSINSVRDRAVILSLDKQSLVDGQVDIMNDFRDNNRAPGRLMYAAVQAFQQMAVQQGWDEMLAWVDDIQDKLKKAAHKVITEVKVDGKSEKRHVDMSVDLALGLAPIQILAEMVGHTDFIKMFDPETKDNLPDRVARVLSVSFQSQGEQTPGRAVLEAVRNLLSSGRAHILNGNDPSLPPIDGDHMGSNRALGWQMNGQGNPVPLGVAIGHLIFASKDGERDVLMLDQTNAFDQAQRHYSSSLPPGTSSSTSFGSVWNEGLIHPAFAGKRDQSRAGITFRIEKHSRRGVPIHINTIIGSTDGE